MAQFTKRVIAPGTYKTRDGTRTVTPARVAHWHKSLQAILATGAQVPVSWGHQSSAEPRSADDRQYWGSRFVAGNVIGSRLVDGELEYQLDVPGARKLSNGRIVAQTELPDGRKVETAIGEVSLGARDWTDGRGREWKDAPVHLALTPLPVWAPEGGQPPFEEQTPGEASYFGMADLLVRFATDGPPAKKKFGDKSGDKPAFGKADKSAPGKADGPDGDGKDAVSNGNDGDDKATNKADEEAEEENAEIEAAGENSDGSVEAILELLTVFGLGLPEDTTPQNFLDRLHTALYTRKRDLVNPAAEADSQQQQSQEAQGAYMSTSATAPDPRLQTLLARFESEERAKRITRIDALVGRGLQPSRAKKMRELASQTNFSLADDGSIPSQSIDEQLEVLEEHLPREDFKKTYLGTTVAPAPEDVQGKSRVREAADEFCRVTGLPARKGA